MHYAAQWKKSVNGKLNQVASHPVNTLTGTNKKIWVAKKAQTGTELVLGSTQQTSPPSSLPSATLPSAPPSTSSPPVAVTGNSSMAY
jgi:hypothetical protein